MKRTHLLHIAILGALLEPSLGHAAGSSDTSWGTDLASELPAEVRERLRALKQETKEEKGSRPNPEQRKDLRTQRERFLQTLPEGERMRLRQKIQQFEERPAKPRDPRDFRDK